MLTALLLALQTAPTVAGPSPEVQTAVANYVQCLTSSPNPDCAALRARTAALIEHDMEAMGATDAQSRRAAAEKLLAQFDALAPQLRASIGAAGPGTIEMIGNSRSYPRDLTAQVERYAGCVDGNFDRALKQEAARTGAEVRSVFARAKAQCAEVRATAAAEADGILRAREPDAARRATIIASALDTVDSKGEAFATAADRRAAPTVKQGE